MTLFLGPNPRKQTEWMTVTYIQQPQIKDGPCKFSQVVGDEGLELIPRWAWKAPLLEEVPLLPTPVSLIRLSVTGGQPCRTFNDCCKRLKKVREKCKKKLKIDDVPFNFMIGADGRVYEGRGWTLEPYKDPVFAPELMGNYLDIAFIGNYDRKFKEPWACRGTANMLLRYGVQKGFITPEHHAETDYADKIMDFFYRPVRLNRWFRPHLTRKTR